MNAHGKIKAMPSSLEAEAALLCDILVNPALIPKCRKLLSGEDFWSEKHRLIFQGIVNTGTNDLVMIASELQIAGTFEKAGGVSLLAELVECATTSAAFDSHIDKLKEMSFRRAIIKAGMQAVDAAYDLSLDPADILSDTKTVLREMSYQVKDDALDISLLAKSLQEDLEDKMARGGGFVGPSTGFVNLDEKMQGLEPGTTTYLLAGPSTGKTALALSIAREVARNRRVLFYSLESNAKAIMRRLVAAESDLWLSKLRTGKLDPIDWDKTVAALNNLSGLTLSVLDHPQYKEVETLTAHAESVAMDDRVALVVVDHIQQAMSNKKFGSRHQEISYVAEQLQGLAKLLKTAVIVNCQISRPGEKEKEIRLFHMKESGDLEAKADNVIALQQTKVGYRDALECIVLKGRDIGTGKTWLTFDRATQRIEDAVEVPVASDKSGYRGMD
jgi:replicative DNA helicase